MLPRRERVGHVFVLGNHSTEHETDCLTTVDSLETELFTSIRTETADQDFSRDKNIQRPCYS